MQRLHSLRCAHETRFQNSGCKERVILQFIREDSGIGKTTAFSNRKSSSCTVNSLADDGSGGSTVNGVEVVTLRWAIAQANAHSGPTNTITFDPSLTATGPARAL